MADTVRTEFTCSQLETHSPLLSPEFLKGTTSCRNKIITKRPISAERIPRLAEHFTDDVATEAEL
jgi:hypothetical protein